MNLRLLFSAGIVALSMTAASAGQAPPPAANAPSVLPSAILQPALSNVQSSTSALNISRWKAPGSVKQAAQENVDSIQRDLGNTLPALIAKADATPASATASFAVYRNIDALYDVLLRVSQTANLAAPDSEADSISTSLQRLEGVRSQLGDSILRISQNNEAHVLALEAEIRSAKTAPPVEQRHQTVVDDGPATSEKKVRRRMPAKKPAAKPAPPSSPSPTK